MKKLFTLLFLGIAALFLISCSKQDSLNGESYWIDDVRNDLVLTIDNNKGTINSDGGYSITLDMDKKTYKTSSGTTNDYTYKDGVFTANLTGVKRDYYKKGSEAYKKALKKYGYDK